MFSVLDNFFVLKPEKVFRFEKPNRAQRYENFPNYKQDFLTKIAKNS